MGCPAPRGSLPNGALLPGQSRWADLLAEGYCTQGMAGPLPAQSDPHAHHLPFAGKLAEQANEEAGSNGDAAGQPAPRRSSPRFQANLRSRFKAYGAGSQAWVGPRREADKAAMFQELQRRGFTLWYRCVRRVWWFCAEAGWQAPALE